MAQTVFSNCAIITTGCYLYSSVGVAVPDGKYSDGSNVFTVTGGLGEITSSESCSISQMMKVAVMGSSTAYGRDASSYSLSFVGRLETYYTGVGDTFTNIAAIGMNTYNALAASVPGKPAILPANNITAALALNTDVILVSYPSNDVAMGFTNQETIDNLKSIEQTAINAGKAIYFIGTQPRDFPDASQRTQLFTQNALILSNFPNNSINVYPDLVGIDGYISPAVSAGDGVHLNDEGHRRIFNRVVQKNIFQPFPTTTTTSSSSSSSSTTSTTTATPTTTSTTTAIATTTSTTTAASTPIVTSGLIMNLDAANPSSYPGSGTSWTNLNGLSFAASLSNTTFDGSDNGGALVFNGTDAQGTINPAQFTDIPIGASARTLMAYVKPTVFNSFQWIFYYGALPQGQQFFMGISAAGVDRAFGGATGWGAGLNGYWTGLQDQWTLITITYDGTTTRLYRNGVEVASNSDFPAYTTTNNDIMVGSSNGANYWTGKMRSILMYDRALSQSEIQQNYNYYANVPVTTSTTTTSNGTTTTTSTTTAIATTTTTTSSSTTTTTTTTTSSTTTSTTSTTTTAVPATTTTTTTAGGTGTWTPVENYSLAIGTNGYYEWLPNGYTDINGTKFPVIIDFNGVGNSGNGNTELNKLIGLNNGATGTLGYYIQNAPGGPNFPYPAIVIIPQKTTATTWESNTQLNNILVSVRNLYAVDTTKIYFTGFSGGGGILTYGENISFDNIDIINNVTAMVSMCTVTAYTVAAGDAYTSVQMPLYLFHGTADSNEGTPYSRSTSWVDNINPGIVPATKLAGYAGVPDSSPPMLNEDHQIWPIVYNFSFNIDSTLSPNKTIYDWLLGWSRLVAPTGFTATAASSTQINLSWSAVAGAVSYKLERSLTGTNGLSGWTQVGGTITTTSFSDTTVSAGTQYFYRLRAVGNGTTTITSKSVAANATTPSDGTTTTTTTSTTVIPATTTSTTTAVVGPTTTSTTTTSNFNPLLGTWEEHYTTMDAGIPQGYYIWKPNTYGTKPLPVILYFGGQGEQGGTELSTMLTCTGGCTLPYLLYNRIGTANAFPHEAIVIMIKYVNASIAYYNNTFNYNPLNRIIDFVRTTYGSTNTNFNRYYMTGFSWGSGASLLWAGGLNTLLDQYNYFVPSLDKIAAMTFVCMSAGGYNSFGGANFKNRNMPMWFLHGDDDQSPGSATLNVNGPAGTGWVASLNTAGYPVGSGAISPATLMNIGPVGTGHNIWDQVLDWTYSANTWKYEVSPGTYQDVYEWMLSKSL
jgi:acyl-CoA thioesterase-1